MMKRILTAAVAGAWLMAGTVGTVAQPNWSTYDETAQWLEDAFEDLGPVWHHESGRKGSAYGITISGAEVTITQSGRGIFEMGTLDPEDGSQDVTITQSGGGIFDGWRWAAGVIHEMDIRDVRVSLVGVATIRKSTGGVQDTVIRQGVFLSCQPKRASCITRTAGSYFGGPERTQKEVWLIDNLTLPIGSYKESGLTEREKEMNDRIVRAFIRLQELARAKGDLF